MAKQKLDKTLLKKAALAAWTQTLHAAADAACVRVGAYERKPDAGSQFSRVMERLHEYIEALNAIQKPFQVTKIANNCDADDDCPDGQICIDGDCDTPFPSS
jgi:hypothetical protein